MGTDNGSKRIEALKARVAGLRERPIDVVGIGECSLDEVWLLPGPISTGMKLRAAARERLGGGQIATALVAAARLGLECAFAGAVGDDAAGAFVLDGLKSERVDVQAVHTVPGGATRTALLLVDEASGERSVIELADRKVTVPPAAVPEALIARAKVVHLDATHPATALQAARLARAHGAIVSLDVDQAAPALEELLALADVCVTAEGLPAKLAGTADLEEALKWLAARTGAFVGCTLGARGAAALDGGHLLFSPAFAQPRVVDTTACGDTFRAATLRAILDGKGVGDALRFANAAAGLKCRALGRRGCPTKSEVDELLARA